MAREPMVTRTIKETKAYVLCMNIQKGEPFNTVVRVPRTYANNDMLLKKVKSIIETDNVKCVHIADSEETKTLYGMTEQEFIECAKILPARKVSNTYSETEE